MHFLVIDKSQHRQIHRISFTHVNYPKSTRLFIDIPSSRAVSRPVMREILTRASRTGGKKAHLESTRLLDESLSFPPWILDRVDFLTPKESRFDTPVRYVTDVHTSTFIDFHARSREGRTLIEAFRNSLAYQPISFSLAFKAYELSVVEKKKRKERFSRGF